MWNLKLALFLACCVALSIAQSSTTTAAPTTSAAGGSTASPGSTVSPPSDATTAPSGGTTASTCADDPNTDCSQYTSLCSNPKYTPLLQQFCPKTCGFCGGGSTVAPVSCVDSSTNCANWDKNGFCSSTFYNCAQKKQYCAKTCNLCSTTC